MSRRREERVYMDIVLILVVVTVTVVLIFDFTNGFHDASNMIATVVASRAMTPIQAVILVGAFHFIGPVLGGTAVANTIGWNLWTLWFGIPSSSSHTLVGGLTGAVVVAAGPGYVVWGFS